MNNPYKFDFKSVGDIQKKAAELSELSALNVNIGFSENYGVLSRKVDVEPGFTLKNSLAIHPMEGFDGTFDGAPGELTIRRYKRFAESGAGLLWVEAVAVQEDARTSPHQLMITEKNVDEFKKLAETVKNIAGGDVKIIIQLTHSGRFSKPPVIACHNNTLNTRMNLDPSYPCVSDDYLKRLEDTFEDAAVLANQAGFDGIDVKNCHRYLFSELLGAFNRQNSEYGDSYENRTRIFKNTIKRIKNRLGNSAAVVSRFGISDVIPYPDGFATTEDGGVDLTETLRLIGEINALGVNLLDITMGTPYYNPHINRPYDLNVGGTVSPSHPLINLNSFINHIGTIQKAYPNMTFVGTGYSYLRQFAIGAAAYAVENNLAKVIGFGRGAFAYKGFANDMLNGFMDSKKCCLTCSKCTEIMRANGPTGCPVRDSEVYMPIYKQYVKKDI
ncbi:MAG: flavin oxidoreductase/NADH oxidase [Oscillospiraceae bacterium]|nr:flavin oxidoreductase/NADH oxidase [Oscillospiraceae bacterium]